MRFCVFLTAAWLVLGAPVNAIGQTGYGEFNVHGATLVGDLFEDSGNALQFGTRVLYRTNSGLSFGGNLDWATADNILIRAGLDGLSANILMYSFEIDYATRVSPRADFFFGGGLGAATVQFDGASDVQNSTGTLVPIGGGIKLLNRPVDPSWAFRVDVRDNIIVRTIIDPVTQAETDEARHNWELSAGISFLFGGGVGDAASPPEPALRPVEEPPPGEAEVPVEGAPDTPPRRLEDALLEAEPPVEEGRGPLLCVDGRAWFISGGPIEVDGRGWRPLGRPEPITINNLVQVGEYDGIPVYVNAFATEPYVDLWLPRCGPGSLFHLYVETDTGE
jgi:hypothetical protein